MRAEWNAIGIHHYSTRQLQVKVCVFWIQSFPFASSVKSFASLQTCHFQLRLRRTTCNRPWAWDFHPRYPLHFFFFFFYFGWLFLLSRDFELFLVESLSVQLKLRGFWSPAWQMAVGGRKTFGSRHTAWPDDALHSASGWFEVNYNLNIFNQESGVSTQTIIWN